jgi:hypothetical protein
VWPVTPPYHFGNVRYLDTSKGVRADEAPFRRTTELVDLGVSSRPFHDHKCQAEIDKESKDALDALQSLPVGQDRLEIIGWRVNKSKGPNGLGAIEWLKFKVDRHVPCNFEVVGSAGISINREGCLQGGKKLN